MATFIINRTSEYLNRGRRYSICIDGKEMGKMVNGETKEFNVSPGQHSVFAKIDWCSSETLSIDINEQETKTLKVGGFKNGNWMMPAGLILLVLSYVFNLLFSVTYLFYLVIPLFLISLYYITFGRKQYLTISEEKS